jgi:hypothetical protein
LENTKTGCAKTAEKAWSWARWRGLPVEERWGALGELFGSQKNASYWGTAVKWIDEAIRETTELVREEVASDRKWGSVLDAAHDIATDNKKYWHAWSRMPEGRKRRELMNLDRFSYDHAAGWIESAMDETAMLLLCAAEMVGVKRERRK